MQGEVRNSSREADDCFAPLHTEGLAPEACSLGHDLRNQRYMVGTGRGQRQLLKQVVDVISGMVTTSHH